MLKIVKHEQEMSLLQVRFELLGQGLRPSFFQSEHPGDGGVNESRVEKRGERDEEDLDEILNQARSDLQSQAGFPNTARTSERYQAYPGAAEKLLECVHLLFAPYKWCEWSWQMVFASELRRYG